MTTVEEKMDALMARLDGIEAALTAPPREFVDSEGAAALLCLSKAQIEAWRIRGEGPAYHKIGRAVRYSVADLRAFAEATRVEALQ